MDASHNVGSVEVALSMGRQKHEEAHDRHGQRRKEGGDGGPHEEVAEEALGRAQEVDEPGPSGGCAARKEIVEEPRDDADVGSDVL